MADHLRQQIADAIEAAVTGLATTGDRVHQGRTWPLDDTDYPALLIYAHGGPSQFAAMADTDADIPLEHDEQISIEGVVRVSGEEPDRTLNTIAAEVSAAVMGDPALGALIERRELVQTDIVTEATTEKRQGSVKLTYRVVFTVPAGNPTTRA